MKNTLRQASYYQLAFKNNLQLTEDSGKVGLLGKTEDFFTFYDEVSEHYMNKSGFEDFLKGKHFEENPMLLDDDLSEAFDEWVVELEIADYERYYDEFKKELEANWNFTREVIDEKDDLIMEKIKYNDLHDLID